MWGQVSHNCTVLHRAVPRRVCEEAGSWLKDSAVLVPLMGISSHTWSNAALSPHLGPPGFEYKKKQPHSTIPSALTRGCCMLMTCWSTTGGAHPEEKIAPFQITALMPRGSECSYY